MKLPGFLWWLPIGHVPEISPQELRRSLKNGKALQIVDARTGAEYQQGTIGRAQHAPVTGLPNSLARLNLDPGRPVVILCLSGHRSRPGTRWLRSHGYDAYSLAGGVSAWQRQGFPLQQPPEMK